MKLLLNLLHHMPRRGTYQPNNPETRDYPKSYEEIPNKICCWSDYTDFFQ